MCRVSCAAVCKDAADYALSGLSSLTIRDIETPPAGCCWFELGQDLGWLGDNGLCWPGALSWLLAKQLQVRCLEQIEDTSFFLKRTLCQ